VKVQIVLLALVCAVKGFPTLTFGSDLAFLVALVTLAKFRDILVILEQETSAYEP